MSGKFALNRGWRDHALFRNEPYTKACAWVWMIERACYKPTKFDINGQMITLQRSQFCASIRQLADAWGWSKSAVDRFITRLKTETMIETDIGTGKLIITICNYDKHQPENEYSGTVSGTPSGTAAGQQRDIKEKGNKEIRDIEPNGSLSQGADAPPEKPAKPKGFDATLIDLPPDVPREEWNAFVAMRKAIRKPVKTAFGAAGLISELRKLAEDGHPPGPVLRQSIAFEYQGVFPLKTGRVNNGNGNHHNQPASGPVDPMVQAHLAREARRSGQQPEFFGDDAGGWP